MEITIQISKVHAGDLKISPCNGRLQARID